MTIDELKTWLHLQPLLPEGGFFAETYRADEVSPAEALPERYGAPRAYGTAIYYLLTPETFSALHRLRSDEIYHFYLGDPVELFQLLPDGTGRVVRLGTALAQGERPQTMVLHGVWQGSRLAPGGQWALLGTTVAPGFDPADFEAGEREALLAAYPAFREWILLLTRG